MVKVVRRGDIPLIDEVEEEQEEEEEELIPPLAEPESSQLSSLESVKEVKEGKEENKIILSQETQVLDQTEEQQRVKVFGLFKSLPFCTDVAITE